MGKRLCVAVAVLAHVAVSVPASFPHGLVGSKVHGLEHYRPPAGDKVLGTMETDKEVAAWLNLTRDTALRKVGEASGRWDTVKKIRVERGLGCKRDPREPAPGNWLAYDELRFWLHCDRRSQDVLFVKVHCRGTNARWGYWLHRVPLDFRGWRRVRIPQCDFEIVNDSIAWTRLSRLMFEVHRKGDTRPVLHLDDVRVVQNHLMLDTPRPARRAKKGDTVTFPVSVENRSDAPRTFVVGFDTALMPHMRPKAEPSRFTVPAKGAQEIHVSVAVPAPCPDAAMEMVLLKVADEADPTTTRRLRLRVGLEVPRPIGLRSREQIQAARERARSDPDAARRRASIVGVAERWDGLTNEDTWRTLKLPPYGVSHSRLARAAGTFAEAFALTGKRLYAEKAAVIIKRYGDPKTGYAAYPCPPYWKTRLWDENYMGVAGWIITIATVYDLVHDAGVLSDQEKHDFATHCLRVAAEDHYSETMPGPNCGNATTMDVAANLAVGFCLRDRYWVEEGLNGYSGWLHEASHDVLDDGFWYEGSVSYHGLSIHYLTLAAEMAFHNGIDLYHRELPTDFRFRHTTQMDGNTSYYFQIPHVRRSKTFRQAFEGWLALTYPDHATPGLNDGGARCGLSQGDFQIANARYRDPRYLQPFGYRTSLWHSPVKGTATGPVVTRSTLLPTTGIACLRNGRDRKAPDIFAMLDYGIFGGGHGHYDRLQLDFWWRGRQVLRDPGYGGGYGDPVRRQWYMRNIAHNAVVVDQVTQWPSCGRLELFESTPDAEIVSASCDTHYPGVAQRRTLMLTPDFLVDINDLASDLPRTYDLFYHCMSTTLPRPSVPTTPVEKPLGSDHGYQHIRDAARGRATGPFSCQFVSSEWSLRIHFPQAEPAEVVVGRPPATWAGGGSVRFDVYVDGKRRFKSRNVDVRNWAAQDIDLDIAGARTLKLYVDSLGGMGCDHACWCDAKLYPADPARPPVYLSDLKPVKHLVHGGLRMDVDYLGGAIIVAGKRYRKGITLHPEGEQGFMTYKLDSGYRRFTATVGLDDGEKTQDRALMFVRKRGKAARFVSVIEPCEKEPTVKVVTLAGETLRVTLAGGQTKTLSLEPARRRGKLPFTAVKHDYRDASLDNRPYPEGVAKDAITFPEEAWRYFSKTEERWQYIPCGRTAVTPGGRYVAACRTRVSPDFVQPAAIRLHEYDARGEQVAWRYLDEAVPRSGAWRDWRKAFQVGARTREIELVICCRGVGVAWFTPPTITPSPPAAP